MTRDEMCRALAEKFEPTPTWPEGLFWHCRSIGGFWMKYNFNPIGPDIVPFNPFDFEDDSAALREAIAKKTTIDIKYVSPLWFVDINSSWARLDRQFKANDREFRNALVFATCKWQEVKHDE